MSSPPDLADVVELARPAVVQVAVRTGDGVVLRLGSGCWLHESGLVVTAAHVIEQGRRDGSRLTVAVSPAPTDRARGNFVHLAADVVAVEPALDLALLQTTVNPFDRSAAPIAGSAVPLPARVLQTHPGRARDGDPVCVSGYPVNEPVLVTTSGIVASAWAYELADLPAQAALAEVQDLYLVDATVNPGNSGGPVYRQADGALLGICLSMRLGQADAPAPHGTLTFPSGLAVVAPARYAMELLEAVLQRR